MRPKFRLSAPECTRGRIFNTHPRDRKPDNAVPRRPKLKVIDGKIKITTRKNMPSKGKQELPMLDSTKPSGKKWRVKQTWRDGNRAK